MVEVSAEATAEAVSKLREVGPLVQCITNFVSMDIMANTLLAAGASPAMAHSLEEVEDFIKISSSLLINMGTLEPAWIASMKLCARKCVELGKPWVMDPVGAGATPYRSSSIRSLMSCSPSVVRGNAGEIMALAGQMGGTKGVDSTESVTSAHSAARLIAEKFQCVVAVSGEVDYVTDGKQSYNISNGTVLLTKITAAGCSVTALIAAFCAVLPEDVLAATVFALAYFSVAGEVAAQPESGKPTPGPGTVRFKLIDTLYTISHEELRSRVRIAEVE